MTHRFTDDLRFIARGLNADDVPHWPYIPCPTCLRGRLRLEPGSLVYEDTVTSRAYSPDENCLPEDRRGAFHCVLECQPSCDRVRVVGEVEYVIDDESGNQAHYLAILLPRFFLPALPLVERHKACPAPVTLRIVTASKVLWSDPSSAANRLRTATEALMDEHGITKTSERESLDSRIKRFSALGAEQQEAGDLLLAVKWLGNVGSHEDKLRVHHVLQGIELLDVALGLLYDKSRDRAKRSAALITSRKGQPIAARIVRRRRPRFLR